MNLSKEYLEKAKIRFFNFVEKTQTCWLWKAQKQSSGYGIMSFGLRPHYAHRISYLLLKGEIGNNFVLHKCDNPSCVNPDHLFLGTQKDNIQDAVKKGRMKNQHMSKTHCPKNHPYNEENTYYDRNGGRYCRICVYERNKLYKRKKRQEKKEKRAFPPVL